MKGDKTLALQKKWSTNYTGTGLVAQKNNNKISLRKGPDGNEFAIVSITDHIDGLPMEIATSSTELAEEKFVNYAKSNEYNLLPRL